jgi:hypothetical protein
VNEPTPLDRPAAEPVTCPRCGRLFERSIEVGGKTIRGHVTGDPATCIPMAGQPTIRDARARRAARRPL